MLSTTVKLELLIDYTDPVEFYWMSGRKSSKRNRWSWSPYSWRLTVDFSVCSPLSTSEACLSYNDGCFDNTKKCDADLLYICERTPKV